MSEQNSMERLPAHSPSDAAPRRARTMTGFGRFLVVSGVLEEAVVLEWERQYTDAVAEEIRTGSPLF